MADRCGEACALLAALEVIAQVAEQGGRIEAIYQGEEGGEHQVLTALVSGGFQVRGFQEEEIDLETIYVRSTQGLRSE